MQMQIDGVSIELRGQPVLRGISAMLQPGRVTVILGANGAGKSTLLSCLAGLRQPGSGAVRLGNRPVLAMDKRERGRMIGLMPQRAEIHWDVDVETLVGLGRMPHRGRWGPTEADRAAISRAMAATGVTALRARKALRLSGGEQGRVLLARVLAGEPGWLLADEPLASLDPAHQLDVLDRLREAARSGAGVVVVLHDLTHAARVADDALVLQEGRLLAAGPAAGVLTPAVLAQAYGVEVHLARTADGAPIIVPVRRIA